MAGRFFYFGCYRDSGHYLWQPGPEEPGEIRPRTVTDFPWTVEDLDDGFCPKTHNHRPDNGVALLTHAKGWTILSFWDNSVDRRPGSHSTFLADEIYDFHPMVWQCKQAFPQVWSRYKFTVSEIEKERSE